MSNALAIAAVTFLLRDLLRDGILNGNPAPQIGDVTVRALPPDRAPAMDNSTLDMVNLFLYRVTPNTGWTNMGYPSHNGRGGRITNPPLALDLHYLLTVFGSEDYNAEILLGYAMQILHENPILTGDAIRESLTGAVVDDTDVIPAGLQNAVLSDLANQFESIRITPHYLDMEEMSRIWSSAQSRYRTSVAYQVSVVLIESQKSTRSSLRVQRYFVEGRTLRPPHIDSVTSSRGARLQIQQGDDLIIRGHNFISDNTTVFVGEEEVTPTGNDPDTGEPNLQDERIRVTPPPAVRAGVVVIRVVQYVAISDPPVDHRLIESNAMPIMYSPRITAAPTVVSNAISGGLAEATIRIMIAPDLGTDQRVTVYLNETTTPAPSDREPFAYSAVAPERSDTDPADQIEVTLSNVEPAEYWVRVRVDGAESPLNPTDPAAPTVDLTNPVP